MNRLLARILVLVSILFVLVSAPRPARADAEDRVVSGGSLVIARDETVRDVRVVGGNVDVYGHVLGDLSVVGGRARVHEGANVDGDARALGGALVVEDGAHVAGDVRAIGGTIHRGATPETAEAVPASKHAVRLSFLDGPRSLWRAATWAVSKTVLLFVFGAVLLALFSGRMDALRAEVVKRPMRTFALGVVGSLAVVAGGIVLAVTIIGVPFAACGAILSAIALAVGVSAVLATVGEALLGHRTRSPYLHLALGCALFLVTTSVPFVGGLVKAAVLLTGAGVMVAAFLARSRPAVPS